MIPTVFHSSVLVGLLAINMFLSPNVYLHSRHTSGAFKENLALDRSQRALEKL